MKIKTFSHFIGDASKSLKRNRTMSTASIATVAATLFILGLFMLTILNVQQMMKQVESQVEVKVILNEDITINEQKDLEEVIKDIEGVKEVVFESKTEAFENLKEMFGSDNESLIDGLDKDEVVPNSYIVKVEEPKVVTNVVEKIKDMPGIYVIKDARELVDKIIAITNAIKWIGAVILIILFGVSLFLIGNTIKLTVYARRREIGIMKYIGATDWFIRWPFILEGAFIGVVGGLTSGILLYFGYKFVYARISATIMMVQFIDPSYILSVMLGEFLLGGILIGVLGSIMAIRKFLAV